MNAKTYTRRSGYIKRTNRQIQYDISTQVKVCTKCGEYKSFDEFGLHGRSPDGRKPTCKLCYTTYSKSYRQVELFKYTSTLRRWRVKYNTTESCIRNVMDKQRGCCAICGKSFSWTCTYDVDHDHDSGSIRGLLCNQCNQGIGLLGDTEEGIFKALQYLQGSSA